MQIIYKPAERDWPKMIQRPLLQQENLKRQVQQIIDLVRKDGDLALQQLTMRYDHVRIKNFTVSKEEIDAAMKKVPARVKKAIQIAADNIRKFHRPQLSPLPRIYTSPGVLCWRKRLPIEKVGLYIPGGHAPLFSTVLMLGIPALLAGCPEIIVCSPPDPQGWLDPVILFTCRYLGLKKIYKVGGAQAVAAMAYGTSNIPAVYKIFGPGNQYVTMAKQLVQLAGVAIDMPAGPSEVLVFADKFANVEFVAADMISQAEHGPDSQSLLVTTTATLPDRVRHSIQQQLRNLPRKKIARQSLRYSKLIVMANMNQAVRFINRYAPEHLLLNLKNPAHILPAIKNAGSVFIGPYAPEAAGDYASGTNHTLPTGGHALGMSGISVESFMKMITFQQISRQGIQQLGPAIRILAEAENLSGHSNAVQVRLNQ